MTVGSASGNNHRLCLHHLVILKELEGAAGKIDSRNPRPVFGAGTKSLGLFLHVDHQLSSVDTLGKPRIIFNNTGGGQQATGLSTR